MNQRGPTTAAREASDTVDVYGRFGRQHSGAYSVPLPLVAAQQRSWDANASLGTFAGQRSFADVVTGVGTC